MGSGLIKGGTSRTIGPRPRPSSEPTSSDNENLVPMVRLHKRRKISHRGGASDVSSALVVHKEARRDKSVKVLGDKL